MHPTQHTLNTFVTVCLWSNGFFQNNLGKSSLTQCFTKPNHSSTDESLRSLFFILTSNILLVLVLHFAALPICCLHLAITTHSSMQESAPRIRLYSALNSRAQASRYYHNIKNKQNLYFGISRHFPSTGFVLMIFN